MMPMSEMQACRGTLALKAAGRTVAMVMAGVALATVFAAGRAAAAGGDPMAVVQQTVNGALAILRNQQVPAAQRRDQLKQIIAQTFDFTEMSRSALGYHWKQISGDQQQEFTTVFTTFIEDSYLAKINDYSGQQVQFVRQSKDGPQYAQVETNIVASGKDPIAVNYRLLSENGQWKIYDVTVEAISIIANYRNQFNRVINNQGYPKLIADLKTKQQSLAASLGDRH
ncbi:MAG TPA: ABC transporter substrate-binding protein [Candidatus Binataceae bacterium]|nr:ABC transporter substrate-binding protein [Candidatus Binataceae bacterium]